MVLMMKVAMDESMKEEIVGNEGEPAEVSARPAFTTRRLTVADAHAVQACYNSQARLMLALKPDDEAPYSQVFCDILASGCVAFGAHDDVTNDLRAFCVVWKWPGLPIGTLVLFVNKPDGKPFNPQGTGLAAAVDAALEHLHQAGAPTVYFIRSASRKWTNAKVTRRFGRFGTALAAPVEYIKAGCVSQHDGINACVLGGRPARVDSVLVCVTRAADGDF
jgi:hypothetical protein